MGSGVLCSVRLGQTASRLPEEVSAIASPLILMQALWLADVVTLLLLTGRPEPEKEKCLPTRGPPGPFTLFQAPLGPSTFLFLQGPGRAGAPEGGVQEDVLVGAAEGELGMRRC